MVPFQTDCIAPGRELVEVVITGAGDDAEMLAVFGFACPTVIGSNTFCISVYVGRMSGHAADWCFFLQNRHVALLSGFGQCAES